MKGNDDLVISTIALSISMFGLGVTATLIILRVIGII